MLLRQRTFNHIPPGLRSELGNFNEENYISYGTRQHPKITSWISGDGECGGGVLPRPSMEISACKSCVTANRRTTVGGPFDEFSLVMPETFVVTHSALCN